MRKTLRLTTVLFFCIYLFSCNLDQASNSKDIAKVSRNQGLYIYILAEPQAEYEPLGIVENDLMEQMTDATKGKKIGKAISELFSATSQNVDFQNLLSYMTGKAKEEYPKAEGLIFTNNLSECTAISFPKTSPY